MEGHRGDSKTLSKSNPLFYKAKEEDGIKTTDQTAGSPEEGVGVQHYLSPSVRQTCG